MRVCVCICSGGSPGTGRALSNLCALQREEEEGVETKAKCQRQMASVAATQAAAATTKEVTRKSMSTLCASASRLCLGGTVLVCVRAHAHNLSADVCIFKNTHCSPVLAWPSFTLKQRWLLPFVTLTSLFSLSVYQ